jgi:hypothetical protein
LDYVARVRETEKTRGILAKTLEKRLFGRLRRRREDNIKMELREMGSGLEL